MTRICRVVPLTKHYIPRIDTSSSHNRGRVFTFSGVEAAINVLSLMSVSRGLMVYRDSLSLNLFGRRQDLRIVLTFSTNIRKWLEPLPLSCPLTNGGGQMLHLFFLSFLQVSLDYIEIFIDL